MKFLALVGPANVGKSTVLAALMRRAGGPRHVLTFRADGVSIPASYVAAAGILALGRFDGRMVDGAERLRPNQVDAIPTLLTYLARERPDVRLVVVDTLAAATEIAFTAASLAGVGPVVVALSAPFPVVALRRPLRHPLAAARALHASSALLAERILSGLAERHPGAVGFTLRNESLADLEAVVERVSCETGLARVGSTRDASTTSPASVTGNTPDFGSGESRFDPSAGGSTP